MAACGAVILAGGRGLRLGGADKASLVYRGKTFLTHIREALAGFSPLYLSAGWQPAAAGRLEAPGVLAVADLLPRAGPMGGLLSVFLSSEEEALLAVPCDTPLFSRELGARMLEAFSSSRADCLVCRDGAGRLHPLCGIYRRSCLPQMETCISEGRLAMRELLGRVDTTVFETAQAGFADRVFTNINTGADYAALCRPRAGP